MKQKKLITKPSYPRSFESSPRPERKESFVDNTAHAAAKFSDEIAWGFMVSMLKVAPPHFTLKSSQLIYDMLLDALDKWRDSEDRLAALRDEFQYYKQTIRSAAQ